MDRGVGAVILQCSRFPPKYTTISPRRRKSRDTGNPLAMEISPILLPQINKSIPGPHTFHDLSCGAIVHRLDGHGRRCMDSRHLNDRA